mmetsp:Transcript_3804/g.6915  ORF Transcript_3804/g.6915 Transcript_3804/m.6915 type:complete len:85 (-) Transcript_3804:431-685(-)
MGEGVGLGDRSGDAGGSGRVGGEVGIGEIGTVTDGSGDERRRTIKPIATSEPTIKMMMVPIDMKMARWCVCHRDTGKPGCNEGS